MGMADKTEDPIEQAAQAWVDQLTYWIGNATPEQIPAAVGQAIASELIRIRLEMTAIRRILQSRP
jgi:hypothetical protein